jgi:hypothetical protein
MSIEELFSFSNAPKVDLGAIDLKKPCETPLFG